MLNELFFFTKRFGHTTVVFLSGYTTVQYINTQLIYTRSAQIGGQWFMFLQSGDKLEITQEEKALVESRYFPDESQRGLFRQAR